MTEGDEFAADVPLDDAARNRCIQCGNSCRSVYLWQGDLAFFKENDTKKWVEFHEIETFTARLPDGRLFWGVDALPMVAAALTGDAWFDGPAWDEAARARPGVQRRR